MKTTPFFSILAAIVIAIAITGCGGGESETCVSAYDEMQQADGQGWSSNAPPRDDFVRGCSELPENVQRCFQMSYAMDHADACSEARNGLSEADQQRIQQLMGR